MRTQQPDIYVLTDARGFTTCILGCPRKDGECEAALYESLRAHLQAPIEVTGFVKAGNHNHLQHRLIERFTWNGAPNTWR